MSIRFSSGCAILLLLQFCSCDGKKVKTGYYANGQKSWELHITDERADGQYTEWDSLGHVTGIVNYKMGTRDGRTANWDASGKLTREEFFTNGNTDSLMMVFADSIKQVEKFKAGYHFTERFIHDKLVTRWRFYERDICGADSLRGLKETFMNGVLTQKELEYWNKPTLVVKYNGRDSTIITNGPIPKKNRI